MTLYEGLLFFHVLGAVAWVGSVLVGAFLFERVLRADDREWLMRWSKYDEGLTGVFYIPAALLVLAAGVGLVLEGPWSFGNGWVLAGLALFVAAFVVVVAFMAPAAKRLTSAVSESGIRSPQVGRHLFSMRRLIWIEAGILVAAVFVMTTKPF